MDHIIDNSLLRYKKDYTYIVFDFETEGLNLHFTRPFQLSWMKVYNGDILYQKDFFIKIEDLKMSEGAKIATHFNQAKYEEKAVNPNLVLEEFEKDLFDKENKIVGHNILGYDVYIFQSLRRLCKKMEDYSFIDRIYDTLALGRAFRFSRRPDNNNFIPWQYKMLSVIKRGSKTKLSDLAQEFQIPFDENRLHESLYDIELNNKVFKKLIYHIDVC